MRSRGSDAVVYGNGCDVGNGLRSAKEIRILLPDGWVVFVAPNAFHLGGMGATRRILQVASAFRELGQNVVLIADGTMTDEEQDRWSREFPGPIIRGRHTGDYPQCVERSAQLKRFWRLVWRLSGRTTYELRRTFGWAERTSCSELCGEMARIGVSPSLIWAVCGGHLDGPLIARRLSVIFDCPWVLALHDPPVYCSLEYRNEVICGRYRQLLKDASAIMSTTMSYRDRLVGSMAVPERKVENVYIRTRRLEDRDVTQGSGQNQFNIVYAGGAGGGRDLRPLVRALAQAVVQEPSVRQRIRVVFAGRGEGFREALELARALNVLDLIDYRGVLDRSSTDELLSAADLLVVIQAKHAREQVPGKIADIFEGMIPTLGIMPTDCEAARILGRSGLGYVYDESDVEQMSGVLIDAVCGRGINLKADENYIQVEFGMNSLRDAIWKLYLSAEENYRRIEEHRTDIWCTYRRVMGLW